MNRSLAVGSRVPNFTLPGVPSGPFELEKMKGQKVVLYFYPKDSTPGCTVEGIDFNRLKEKFARLNTVVFGISRDSLASHQKFIHKFRFRFDLLSDADEKICQLFDVIKEKNMYGKKVMGIERSTFVINEDQVLIGEFRKVKAEGHAEAILEFVKENS
ncbi:MAG: peroxiredoxin [Bdellovibrionales bacterium RIFCSPHIGHO2_01_FULL_40_29]|nr:MAG: peroxiredoxin [Bdellovibrionales bacterium RIFCSPHIGHO2_01_FULL_40_29]OFZ34320.1 MAG: peroxiredoxin [Bdellovibrionales bacterium RIFCSPHIGHO2_02_FULL_40_15]